MESEKSQALLRSLSPERLGTYQKACGSNIDAALALYEWNTRISAAFYVPLQGLEITLRNVIHIELAKVYGEAWYMASKPMLDDNARRKIDDAYRQVALEKNAPDTPHIIAALSFGFWVSLLGSGGIVKTTNRKADYEAQLWRPALWRGFKNSQSAVTRKTIHRPLDYLRTFRNRIAHHEPIFDRDLNADYESIIRCISMMCPYTATWVAHTNNVQAVLSEKPVSITRPRDV